MRKLLKNFVILFTAIFLSVIFYPFGFLVSVFYSIVEKNMDYFAKVVLRIAVSIDQLGNVICGDLFDLCMVKTGDPFGHEDDTVSDILARNQQHLTWLGKSLMWIIKLIDPQHFEGMGMKTKEQLEEDLKKYKQDFEIAKQQVNIIQGCIMATENILNPKTQDGKK